MFTLLHELGHAVAARSAGADAAISLDFMAGYTSFRPRRPISKPRLALISVSGPAIQIVIEPRRPGGDGRQPHFVRQRPPVRRHPGDLVGRPRDRTAQSDPGAPARRRTPGPDRARGCTAPPGAARDGDRQSGHHARRRGRHCRARPHRLRDLRRLPADQPVAAAQATSPKRRAAADRPSTWGIDGVSLLPGSRPSPWQLAYQAVVAGDTNRAQRVIVEDLVRPTPANGRRWSPPTDAPLEALAGGRRHVAFAIFRPATPTARRCWRRSCW